MCLPVACHWLSILCFVSLGFACCETPVKVFILAGQSNMVGRGSLAHLQELLNDTSVKERYQHLWDEANGEWAELDDVYIRFNDRKGKLAAGYGSLDKKKPRFGPELEFGNVIARKLNLKQENETVLIIKFAWGGYSLALNFRPPLSCWNDRAIDYPSNAYKCRNDPEVKCQHYKPSEYGTGYRDMIAQVRETLANIESYVPNFQRNSRVSLAGMVWFQGWNDMIDPFKVEEYHNNLVNLIRSVRLDLESPNLSVVIGELGQHGIDVAEEYRDKVIRFREIQENVTKLFQFRNNTKFVKTSPYVIKMEEEEQFDGEYHYYGRADTFFDIGQAFGEAMVHLLVGADSDYENPER